MNPVAIRLLNQQLIVPQFKTPTEVVSHMGAMQAQEYRMMRWAVEMRTQKPSQSLQGGLRQRADYPSAPDARYLATGICGGLLVDDRPLRSQGHRCHNGMDAQQ